MQCTPSVATGHKRGTFDLKLDKDASAQRRCAPVCHHRGAELRCRGRPAGQAESRSAALHTRRAGILAGVQVPGVQGWGGWG